MAGISSTLSIAKTAIASQQYGLNITGQNIANVNNPDYSVQSAEQKSMKPALYAGFLFGTGVDTYQVSQRVDQLLEDRLTGELSSQASFEEQESYMLVLESFFDENSEKSITSSLTEFWNSWHDLSDNPMGSAERVAVLENGKILANTFESLVTDMDGLSRDITSDINAAITRINTLSSQIADLNKEIASIENGRTANDIRDQRNSLIDELGGLIDINSFEQSDGSLTINVANAFTIVNGIDTRQLKEVDKKVVWVSSSGSQTDISSKITEGKIGGLLEIRDEVIPKYRAEINELSREMIWAINYQASQGVGLEYLTEPVIGEYTTDDTGWLTSFEFGDKIDASKEFVMWMEDKTNVDAQYTKIDMDIDISQAGISNWQGQTPGSVQGKYRLTVVDSAVLGDQVITESDGDGLGYAMGSTADVATTLNSAIAEQTIKVYDGPSGTGVIQVNDTGGGAKRSAASIAAALNEVDGVNASASETHASFETSGIVDAQDGDEIKYSIYVDGILQEQSFFRDSTEGTVQEQFEDSLLLAAAAVNVINEDDDLFVEGLSITSQTGRTLGVQDFDVVDNAGMSLNNFLNFDSGDTVSFTVDSMVGTSASETTAISVNLTGVDTEDQAQVALAFSDALTQALDGKAFTVVNDLTTNSVVIRTTDGTDIRLKDAGDDIGDDATINTSEVSGSVDGGNIDSTLEFNAAADDTVRYDAITFSTDNLTFEGQGISVTINETTAAAGDKSGVITGTVTALVDPGMSIYSNVSGAGSGGLYDSALAKKGSSIMTLGGEGGFSNFTAGETISFDLDGTAIDLTISTAAGSTTDIALAIALETELNNDLTAGLVAENYQVIRTGATVSVLKNTELEDPIEITNFTETDVVPLGDGNNATLQVRTGTGTNSNQPQNDLLESGNTNRDFSTSSLYNDEGTIFWERLDEDGVRTGSSGLITVEDAGSVAIIENGAETISFDISEGSLVAGNTLILNTDESGSLDHLDFNITGQANSINDIYHFKIVSGGKVGHVPGEDEDPLVIEWSNSVETGSFTIEGHDPPYTPAVPVEVSVDGMNLRFYDGTLLSGDVFTITTGDTGIPVSVNDAGQPTGETLSDWHWTIDSFADEFNRQAPGLKASTTLDNRLKFETSDAYYKMDNLQYSEENGFNQVNCSIDVKDWETIDFAATDLRFVRSQGEWGVMNDPTGGIMTLIPEGGDDDGFGVDFTGDGLADIQISFAQRASGDGFVEFDLRKQSANDIGFAFSDDVSSSSGLVAAAGINTFFKGSDAMTMELDSDLYDTKFITAATIDSETGKISQGDNTNALAMADVQFQSAALRLWTFSQGSEAESNKIDATLDDYFNQMISSLGIESRSIKNSKAFADKMVNNISEQRHSISAVSLDEEMIKLIKYQHAFSAAAKLLTISDEMLNTLISMR